MSNFSLIAKFGMDATGVRTEIKQLRNETNDFVADWAKIGLAAGAAAFVALSKGAIELAGSLSDVSANLGVNVISLQALEAQHKRNGVSNEDLIKGLEKVKDLSVKAAEGDQKAAESLEKLGLKAADFIKLPLDKQYEAIALATVKAKNQTDAYSAVSDIFGAKIGPKMMGSLKELGEIGLPGVTKAAREAGQVMETETIVALDRAGDAIDDFKRRATIAVGNIIVNFSSEDGLKLLLYQFLNVVGKFGAGILDAIKEANDMLGAVFTGTFKGLINFFQDGMVTVLETIASTINKILPAKFEINVGNLDEFRSSGKSIGDEITEAIAKTSPSTFKKDVGDFWGDMIKDQQKVVDALNHTSFGADAKKLEDAGKAASDHITGAGKDFAHSVDAALDGFFGSLDKASTTMTKGATNAGETIEDAANKSAMALGEAADELYRAMIDGASKMKSTLESITIGRTGADYKDQSTTALQGVADNLNKQLNAVGSSGGLIRNATVNDSGDFAVQQFLVTELDAVKKELASRQQFQRVYDTQGSTAALRQYGDSDYQRFTQDITSDTKKTANALGTLVNGLQSRGILPP